MYFGTSDQFYLVQLRLFGKRTNPPKNGKTSTCIRLKRKVVNRMFPQESFGYQSPAKNVFAQNFSKFHSEKLATVTGVSEIVKNIFVEGITWQRGSYRDRNFHISCRKMDSCSSEDVPKAKRVRATINWTDTKLETCLQQVKVSKCHLGKGLNAKYELVASILNAKNEHFKDSVLIGPKLNAKVDKAIINYEGKFLCIEANKSGFEGNRDDETNYMSIELLAKSLYEYIKKEEEAKVAAKSGLGDLSKQKAGLEASALGLSNRTMKAAISRMASSDRSSGGYQSRSSTGNSPVPTEDPTGSSLESFAKSKTQEATISMERWEEEKRVSNIRVAMAERNMLLEVKKLKLAKDKLRYDLLLLKSQNR